MNAIGRYLAEEVVVDYADGLVDRREALRRLGLLGVGVAMATSMLAACEASGPPATGPSGSPGGGPGAGGPAGPSAQPTESIAFANARGGQVRGAYAAPSSPRGAVLVIHENRGLTDHIRSVAGRLAASGYAALAIDLLSEEGGTAAFADPAQATAALNAAPPQRFIADLRSGLDELARRHPDRTAGAVGFCFGGGMVWSLLRAGEPRLRAAVPFYGPVGADPSFTGSPNAAVLAVYAEQDARINAGREEAAAALRRAGLTHELVTYPGVNHAFFNDTGPRYHAATAAAAYQRMLDWFGRHLT